jgi:hypothetical protein
MLLALLLKLGRYLEIWLLSTLLIFLGRKYAFELCGLETGSSVELYVYLLHLKNLLNY